MVIFNMKSYKEKYEEKKCIQIVRACRVVYYIISMRMMILLNAKKFHIKLRAMKILQTYTQNHTHPILMCMRVCYDQSCIKMYVSFFYFRNGFLSLSLHLVAGNIKTSLICFSPNPSSINLFRQFEKSVDNCLKIYSLEWENAHGLSSSLIKMNGSTHEYF